MKKNLLCLFLLFVLTGCNNLERPSEPDTAVLTVPSENKLRIIIQESPPFSYTEDGNLTGFVAETVKEIIKREGIDSEIEILPFKRGYEIVSSEPNVVLCGMTRTEERENLFKWVGPVSKVVTSFYGNRDSNLTYDSLEAFKSLPNIGVTLGYYTEQFLKDNGFTNIDAAVYPEDMLEKLLNKRNDVILSDNIAIEGLLEDPAIIEPLYTISVKKSYLAFSIGTDPMIVDQWHNALNALYEDGTFEAIFRKWLPNEPLPNEDE